MVIKSPEKLTNNSEKIVRRNAKGQLEKGVILNPKGKPVGTKSFSTLMDETIKDIAKLNNITEQEAWKIIIKRAYSEAKDGNFNFYKDIIDRYFGKVTDKTDITSKGESINIIKYADNSREVPAKNLSDTD